jgi:glycerol-3-phosphate acyltransferase PlsY
MECHPFLLVVLAYLLGPLPFRVVISRARGLDIQAEGSGNTGATNVARSLGKKIGLLVLLLDALKGALPVMLLRYVAADDASWLSAVGFAAVFGHCHSPWLKFTGGKGVATALGVYLAVSPAATLAVAVVFAVVFALSRHVSLGSIAAAWSMVVIAIAFEGSGVPVVLASLLAVLITLEHHTNLRRLLWR